MAETVPLQYLSFCFEIISHSKISSESLLFCALKLGLEINRFKFECACVNSC